MNATDTIETAAAVDESEKAKARLTVNERERTLVEQARRVEKALARLSAARQELADAEDHVRVEQAAMRRMVGGE